MFRTLLSRAPASSHFICLGPSVRTLVNFAKPNPTVFEPLPKKRSGQNALEYVQKKLLDKFDPTGKRRALVGPNGLRSGDIIRVTYQDRSVVVGQVIGVKRGHMNVGTNIHIRNKLTKVGVEMRVPLYNPTIRNIEIVSKPEEYLSRRKHYYIRNSKHDVGDLDEFAKVK